MALCLPKILVQASRHNGPTISRAVQVCDYSTQPRIIKNPTTASLKRGTGGRSSFNGTVCTVFGCTGFLGRYIVNRLGKVGTQMILPFRGSEYMIKHLKVSADLGQILFHPFHLKDPDSIYTSVKYSNTVINLIGAELETNNFSLHDVNVEGARRIARICKEAGVERLIHVSMLNASPDPKPLILDSGSKILKTKWEGECAVREEFPEATIVRLSDVYGQEDRFLTLYCEYMRRKGGFMHLWKKGKQTEKQPLHVSDAAAGIVAAALDRDAAGKTYQFFGPDRYTLHDLANWFIAYIEMDFLPYERTRVVSLGSLLYTRLAIAIHKMTSPHTELWMDLERLEYQHASDVIDEDLPTLSDFGITPSRMATKLPWEIRVHLNKSSELITPHDMEVFDIPTPINK